MATVAEGTEIMVSGLSVSRAPVPERLHPPGNTGAGREKTATFLPLLAGTVPARASIQVDGNETFHAPRF